MPHTKEEKPSSQSVRVADLLTRLCSDNVMPTDELCQEAAKVLGSIYATGVRLEGELERLGEELESARRRIVQLEGAPREGSREAVRAPGRLIVGGQKEGKDAGIHVLPDLT